jgi:hypothetical protein
LKKPLKIILGTTLGLGVFATGLFSQQVYTKATTDWKTNTINTASSTIGDSGYQKKQQLVNSATTDINAKIQQDITPEIDAQKADLEKLLDQYYQMKLDGLENSQDYKDLQNKITSLKNTYYNAYVQEIDKAFSAQVK